MYNRCIFHSGSSTCLVVADSGEVPCLVVKYGQGSKYFNFRHLPLSHPPAQQSRFRNRKINFKTKLAVKTGSLDVSGDDATNFGADAIDQGFGDDKGDSGRVETGVDKEEEGVRCLELFPTV